MSEDVHLVSVFCPPLQGHERDDAGGGYEASDPGPKTERRMFVKRASEMRAAGKELVVANGWARTIRMLTKADDLGFGFSDVHLAADADAVLWYKHHWEANHILDGLGEVTDLTSGASCKLEPGLGYNVGPQDRHRLRATTDLHLSLPPRVAMSSVTLKARFRRAVRFHLARLNPFERGRLACLAGSNAINLYLNADGVLPVVTRHRNQVIA